MLRALEAAALALLLVVHAPGQSPKPTSPPPAKPLTLKQVWTLDSTYADHENGVTFRYPSAWKATTDFGYHPAALTASDTAPIAGFGYSEGGFPRDTIVGPYAGSNLEGFGIVYSAVPSASAAECEAKGASMSNSAKSSVAVFGHRSYWVYKTEEAGMSQSISGDLYVTFAGSTCYLFETDVAAVSPGVVDGIKALTPAQGRQIDTHLLDIMKSVRIAPKER